MYGYIAVCVCVSVCMYVCVCVNTIWLYDTQGNRKRVMGPLELELQVVVSCHTSVEE